MGGLTFKTGGGAHIGRFNVTLNGRDLYDIEYLEGGNRPPYRPRVWTTTDLYAEDLGMTIRALQEHRSGVSEGKLGPEWGSERRRAGGLLGRTGDRAARRAGRR
jgi:hypothetical protein